MKKRSSQATLAEVAHAAGVGIATASRAMNGGANVSPQTLKKVETAIRQFGYLPNHAARILKGGRTKTIGLLVPSIADSFFARCAEVAGEVASQHDSLLIVTVSNNRPDTELTNLSILMRHRPDGLLLVPSDAGSKQLLAFVRDCTVPVITFDRPLLGAPCASVLTNNFEAARDATAHLIEHGYKRILCFGGEPELYTVSERIRGYRDAMKKAGLPPMEDATLNDGAESAQPALRKHLSNRRAPQAIFTLKNSTTIAAFQALQRLEIAVPSSVALLGFDDFELAGTLRPSLSVVQQPIEELGRKAAELLFARLEKAPSSPRHRKQSWEPTILPNRLVIRTSCGCTLP
jgi:LacI family transcriptional regulator